MNVKGSRAMRVMGGEKKKDAPKPAAKKSGKKKPVHRMNIRRAANGGFIVEHHMKPDADNPMAGGPEMEEHQVGDVDALQQHVADHMGDQPDAEQPDAEQPEEPEAE